MLAGEPVRSYAADTLRVGYAENTGGFLGLGADLPPAARTAVFSVDHRLRVAGRRCPPRVCRPVRIRAGETTGLFAEAVTPEPIRDSVGGQVAIAGPKALTRSGGVGKMAAANVL